MKKLAILLALLGASLSIPAAHAQSYGLYQTCSLTTATGQAVPGAQVYFLDQPANTATLTPQAQVYSSTTGGAVSQPLTTNGLGNCVNSAGTGPYLAPGLYTVCYVSQYTGQLCYPDQAVFLPSGANSLINPITQILWPIASGATLPSTLCPTGTTGSLTNGSPTVIVASTASIYVNQLVTGTGIPSGTYVLSINASASTVTLTQNATTTQSGVTLSFASIGQPFQDTANNQEYFCSQTGWSASSVVLQYDSTDLPDQALLNFLDDGTIAPDTGYSLVNFKSNSDGGLAAEYLTNNLQTQVQPPDSGQYVVLYPTAVTTSGNSGSNTVVANASGSAYLTHPACGGGGQPGCGSNVSATWSGFSLPSGIDPSDVTEVYAFAIASVPSAGTINQGFNSDAHFNSFLGDAHRIFDIFGGSYALLQQYTQLQTGATGTTIPSIENSALITSTDFLQGGINLNVASSGLIVYYTGTPVTSNSLLNVSPPLDLNLATNTLEINQDWPFPGFNLIGTTVGSLPSASLISGSTYRVLDGASATDCSRGGGSIVVDCISNGTTYTGYVVQTTGTSKDQLTSAYTNSTTTPSTIWSFPVAASQNYHVVCSGDYMALSGGAFELTVTGPASPAALQYTFRPTISIASNVPSDQVYTGVGTSYPTSVNTTPVGTASTDYPFTLVFNLNNGTTAGTLAIQGNTISTDTLTVENTAACTVVN